MKGLKGEDQFEDLKKSIEFEERYWHIELQKHRTHMRTSWEFPEIKEATFHRLQRL